MPEDKPKTRDKYWICSDCAKSKGWVAPEHSVTMILGACAYCDTPSEQMLIPTIDFKRPGRFQVWD